jgi:Flp pilus assembly protein TadG
MQTAALHKFRRLSRIVRREDGQALVEFALVAPLLLVILFGVIDFGKAFDYWNTETQMAEQGARLAAVNGGTTYSGTCADGTASTGGLAGYIQCQAPTTELRNGSSGAFGATKAIVTVCSPVASPTGQVGQPVRVQVTTSYTWLPLLNLSPVGVAGVATMRLEQQWTPPPPPC